MTTTLHKRALVFSNSEWKSDENKGKVYLILYAYLDMACKNVFLFSLCAFRDKEKELL